MASSLVSAVSGTGFNQLLVANTINLGNSTLIVTSAAGFTPIPGQRFTIIDPPIIVGQFAGGARDIPPELPLYRHYGLYAYRVGFLRQYPTLAPAPIERFEALEQLRALWYGFRIIVRVTRGAPAPGVDTAEDLERVRGIYARRAV